MLLSNTRQNERNEFMKKSIIAIAMLSGISVNIQAATNGGSGTVTFTGSVIEAACSIKASDVNQTVDMGQVSVTTLTKYKQSTPRPFKITLEGCDMTNVPNGSVDVMFTGTTVASATTQLEPQGLAKGVAIEITNTNAGTNTPIKFGTATSIGSLVDGTNTLSFSAKMVPIDPAKPATPGDFTALANFALQYN
ncbi:fimbrial protein [Aeromonas veronii]|uniref:fimbrial protein n=1 Tax=Aeromonas veronii TaxID=654 RepID=UPI003D2257C6